MLGSETQPVWVEVAEFLRSALPHVDECTIDGAGYLLPIQRPEAVAQAMSEFLATYSIGDDGPEALERPSRSRGTRGWETTSSSASSSPSAEGAAGSLP
jgi:hypothetical protein